MAVRFLEEPPQQRVGKVRFLDEQAPVEQVSETINLPQAEELAQQGLMPRSGIPQEVRVGSPTAIQDAVHSIGRGAVGGYQAAGEGMLRGLSALWGQNNPFQAAVSNFWADAADEAAAQRQTVREALPVSQEFEQSLPGAVLEGTGQLATIPLYGVPGLGPTATIAQVYQEGYDDAVQGGATPEVAQGAAKQYLMAAAPLEILTDKLIAGRAIKAMGGGTTIGDALKEVAKIATAGGASEAGQQTALNVVAAELSAYDPKRQLTDDVLKSALVGGIVAGIGATGAQAVGALSAPRTLEPSLDPKVNQIEQRLITESKVMAAPGSNAPQTASNLDRFLQGERISSEAQLEQKGGASVLTGEPTVRESLTIQPSVEPLSETINQGGQNAIQIESPTTQVLRPETTGQSQGVELPGVVEQNQPESVAQPQAQEIRFKRPKFGPESGALNLEPIAEAIDTVRQAVPGKLRAGEEYQYSPKWRSFWGSVIERGQLPESLRAPYERMAGRINAVRGQIGVLSRDVQKAVNQLHKSKTDRDAEMGRIQDALTQDDGMDISALEPALQGPVWKLRQAIDTLSQYAIDTGIVEGDLADTFRAGIGNYLRRGYAVFDPESGWNYRYLQKNQPEILSNARTYLKETNPDLSYSEIEATIKQLLDRDVSMGWMLGGKTKLGKATGSLIQRKDIAPPIRELLGEIKDPLVNAIRSGDFLAQLNARHEMQQEFRDIGQKLGLLTTEQDAAHPVEMVEDNWSRAVDSDGNPVFNRKTNRRHDVLRGLYASPEFRDAFAEIEQLGTAGASKKGWQWILEGYLAGSAVSKTSATLFNPDSYAPNYIGALILEAANGRLRPSTWGDAWQSMTSGGSPKETIGAAKAAGIKDARQLYTELLKRGVLDQNLTYRDFEATLKNSWLKKFAPTRAYQNTLKATSAIFQAGDNLGKANAFIDEMETLRRAFPDQPIEQLMDEAAAITQNTTLTYDTVPKGLRDVSQAGFFLQNFLNFTYSVMRSTAFTAAQGRKELASGNPVLIKRGARRLAALTATLSAASYWGVAALSRKQAGVDDEEDEAFRRSFAPPWDRDSNLVYGDVKDGKFTYSNQSYLLPQSLLVEAATAGAEGKNPVEVAQNVMRVFAGNFFDEGIFLSALLDVSRNKAGDTGRQVFNPELDSMTKAMESGRYVWRKSLEPKVFAKTGRIINALTGEKAYGGTEYSVANEIYRLAGYRARTVDIKNAVPYHLYNLNGRWREAERIEQQAENRNLSGSKLQQAQSRGSAAKERVLKDYKQFLDDAQTLGVSRAEIMREMKNTRTQLELRVALDMATGTERRRNQESLRKKAREK